MDKAKLRAIVKECAQARGYRMAANKFWKRHEEITTIFSLQASQWSPIIYVNYGATPNEMVIQKQPPSPEYCSAQGRAASLPLKHVKLFEKLQEDATMNDAKLMREPMLEFIDWLDGHFGDATKLRQRLIKEPAAEKYILGDWARGKLQSPKHYYDYLTRYYG